MRHTANELIKSLETPISDIREALPISNIQNGLIKKSDGKFVKLMEINPINFHLRSSTEQNRVVDSYWSWLNGAPDRFQINIRLEEGTVDQLMRNITDEVNGSNNLLVMQCGYDRMNMLEYASASGLLNKRYFVSCEYDQTLSNTGGTDENSIANVMNGFMSFTDDKFQYMDCSVKGHEYEDDFLMETLYQYCNPGSDQKDTFAKRKERILKDRKKIGIDSDDVIPFLAPRTYSTYNPDFLYLDGKFQTYLFIRDNGYPVTVGGGWIDALTRYGKNVNNIAIHFKREKKEPIIYACEKSMNFKRSTIRTTASGKQEKQEDLAAEVNHTKYIHDALKKGGQDFYWVNTIITITADTYAQMNTVKRELIRDLRSTYRIQVRSCGYHYEDAFRMSLPICYDAPEIRDMCKRNFITESVAGMFPFSSFSLYSPAGVPVAINLSNRSIVAPDFFDTSIFPNPNILILGTTGAGKTYTELILGYCFRLIGIQCMFVLPVKGYEYQRATNAIGGSYIKLGPGMETCLNFLEIRPEKDPESSVMEGEIYRSSYLSKKLTEVKTIFQLLMRDEMSVLEENKLDQVLIRLYGRFGITKDNDSIWEDEDKKKIKKMPIPEDLYEEMKDDPDLKVLTSCLTIFTTGSCSNMNGQTNIDLENKFIVFDVDSEIIDAKLHPVFLYIAFTFCYSRAKENRGEKCMLFTDEVWKMMVHKLSANLVFEAVKLIRGYGAGIVIATQDINDFMRVENDSINDSIINNCSTKILLKMERKGLRLVEQQLELNNNEIQYLQKITVGDALVMAGTDHVPVHFVATQREDELFTTNPKKLANIRKKEKEVKEHVLPDQY